MASDPASGSSAPASNLRFTSQRKTAEDLLSTQTVGLVALSDFRKRRAEAIEAKEKDAHDAINSTGTGGRTGPSTDEYASNRAFHFYCRCGTDNHSTVHLTAKSNLSRRRSGRPAFQNSLSTTQKSQRR